MKTLILGLGNDLLGDDAIGLNAAAELGKRLDGQAEVRICRAAGLALLDELVGYDRAIIIDAIHTGKHPTGTVLEMAIDDLRVIPGTSPHYVGLPEVMVIGRRLGLPVPEEVNILAVEIPECLEIGGEPCRRVASAMNQVIAMAEQYLQSTP
jgi:hydrogenase maturation protease